jgi:hypothetical protein
MVRKKAHTRTAHCSSLRKDFTSATGLMDRPTKEC